MDQEATILTGGWLWGGLWVVYACFYGRYFKHVARRAKPDASYAEIPGSRERLLAKQKWCYRFAGFMLIPAVLETLHSSVFTSVLITVLPCVFGLWVMQAVWREVLHSKIPESSSSAKGSQR